MGSFISPFVPISPRNDRSRITPLPRPLPFRVLGKYFPPRSLRVLIRLYSSPRVHLLPSNIPVAFARGSHIGFARIIPIQFPAFFNSFGKLQWTVYIGIHVYVLHVGTSALHCSSTRSDSWLRDLKSPGKTSIAWKSASFLRYASCPRANSWFCWNYISHRNLTFVFFLMHTEKFKIKTQIPKNKMDKTRDDKLSE